MLVLVLAACGSHRDYAVDGSSLSKLVEETLLVQRRLEVERLAHGCRPQDIARLLAIGADDSMAASQEWREMRCAALSAVWVHHPIPHHWNAAVIHRGAAVLGEPDTRAVIAKLLRDDVSWCTKSIPGEELHLSPQGAASQVLVDFPVPALRADLETAAARDEQEHRHSQARSALRILDIDRNYREGPRADRIDSLVADGTPEAFDRLIQFVAQGMPWNDGRPAPSPEEDAEVRQHVDDAFQWLNMLGHRAEPEIDHGWEWDCEIGIRRAVKEGDLGRHLMEQFERLDVETRSLMLDTLTTNKADGFAEWRARIAKEDPDPGIREAAAPDPLEQLHQRDAGIDGH